MQTLNLTNITIKKLEDRNLNPYYLIVNNDDKDQVFFCFEKAVKSGWNDLTSNWEKIREVEIEFEEKEQGFKTYKKVINLYNWQEKGIFI